MMAERLRDCCRIGVDGPFLNFSGCAEQTLRDDPSDSAKAELQHAKALHVGDLGGCRAWGWVRAGASRGANLGVGEAVWQAHTTSRQRQVAPREFVGLAPALRIGPEWGRMRCCKGSPDVQSGCALRLASTPIPIQRGPIPKPDSLLAEGIQMGTRFVASAESPVHAGYKSAIVAAEATGTWVLNKKATPCIRTLKTNFTAPLFEAGVMPADVFKGIRQVYFDGAMDAAPALAGESAGLIHDVLSVQQIIEQTIAQFHAIGARLGSLAVSADFG